MTRIPLATMDAKQVSCEIQDFIIDQTLAFRRTGGVIGLSGGVDSTVTAALAKRAYDGYNERREHGTQPLELVGYMLPSGVNAQEDLDDAISVAETLRIRYEVCDIQPVADAFGYTNPEAIASAYHAGNLMSEMRAVILHGKSASENKSVIGTGNRDEDRGIGYYTMFGDGAVHMNPIGMLPKRLVREMASYLGCDEAAHRTPTAGLEPGQSDFGDLGYSYDAVEIATEGFMSGMSLYDISNVESLRQRLQQDLDMYQEQFGSPTFGSVDDALTDLARRYNTGLAKRRLISPPTAEVTLRYDELYA